MLDKIVYVHKLSHQVEILGTVHEEGKIVYVGSGHKRRMKAKVNRSHLHLSLWDALAFEIIAENLSLEQAIELEQKLITEHWDSFLLNKKQKADNIKTYVYTDLSKLFYLDKSNKLRWRIDRLGHYGQIIVKRDTIAGYFQKSGYGLVCINKINYSIHRIVWCLHNQQDAPSGMVVDHIDQNPSNNSPLNLRLVSHRVNQQNKKSCSNTSEKHITYYEKSQYFLIQVSTRQDFITRKRVYGIKSLVNKGVSFEEAYQIKFEEALLARDEILQNI